MNLVHKHAQFRRLSGQALTTSVFKVTPGPLVGIHRNNLMVTSAWMRFSTQLAGNVSIHVLSKEPETLEIDQFKPALI